MGTFFQVNWIVFVVTGLIVLAGYYGEKSIKFVSKTLKVEPKSFYLIIVLLGIILSLVNFIAIEVFGSWQSLILSALAVVVLGYGIMKYLKRDKKEV